MLLRKLLKTCSGQIDLANKKCSQRERTENVSQYTEAYNNELEGKDVRKAAKLADPYEVIQGYVPGKGKSFSHKREAEEIRMPTIAAAVSSRFLNWMQHESRRVDCLSW